jgi:Cu2+-exporting ATPase
MLASAGALARGGVLVRRLQALETLASVDTLLFDKTGTLTRDAMVLGTVTVRQGLSADEALAMATALASHSLHPVSRALVAAQAQKIAGAHSWTCEAVTEHAGQGVGGVAFHSSAIGQSTVLRLGSARFCGVTEQNDSLDLCAYLADEQGWLATFGLTEALRPEATAVVAALCAQGVEVHMLSGDNGASVTRVAAQVGITQARGGCSPDDKLDFMRDLQARGRSVAMVGDGLNDGPVLAGANVSFTFGRAVPLAQSKADFVILGEQLMSVVQALVLSRRTLAIVRQNLWWALIYNAACVPLAVVGLLPAWLAGLGMATSSLLVVLNALRLARAVHPERGI